MRQKHTNVVTYVSRQHRESCTLLAYMLILKTRTRVLKVQLSEFLLFLPRKLQPRSVLKVELFTVSRDLGSRS